MLLVLIGLAVARRSSRKNREFEFIDGDTSREMVKRDIRRAIGRRVKRKLRDRHVAGKVDQLLRTLGFTYDDPLTDFLDQWEVAQKYQDMVLNKKRRSATNSVRGAYLPIVVPPSMQGDKKMWQFTDAQKKQVIDNPIFGFAAYPLFPEDGVDVD